MANFPIDIPINIPGLEKLEQAAISLVRLGVTIQEFRKEEIALKVTLKSDTWKAEIEKLKSQIGEIPLKASFDAKELKLPKEHTIQVKLDLRDAETSLKRMFLNPGGYGAQKVISQPQQQGAAQASTVVSQAVEKATQQNTTKAQPFKVSVTLDMESKKKIDTILQNNIKNLKLELSNLSVSGTALSNIQRAVEQTVQKSSGAAEVKAASGKGGGGGGSRGSEPSYSYADHPQPSGKMKSSASEEMIGMGAGAVGKSYDFMRNSIFQGQLAYWSASFLLQNPISSKMMSMGQQAYGFGKESILQTDDVQRMKLQLFGATRSQKVTNELVDLSRQIELTSVGTFKDIFGVMSSLAIQPTLKPVMQGGNKQDIKKLVQTTQMLGLMNPFGMEGAQFIMQEMMSGELYSVGRRLNVTPDTMLAVAGSSRAKYNAASALERADILGTYSRKIMGEDTLDRFNQTFKNTMENTTGYVQVLQTHIGEGGSETKKGEKVEGTSFYQTLTNAGMSLNKTLQDMQTVPFVTAAGGTITQNKVIGETFGSVGKTLVNAFTSTVQRTWEGGSYKTASGETVEQPGLKTVFAHTLAGVESWRDTTAKAAEAAASAPGADARSGERVWTGAVTEKLQQLTTGFVSVRNHPNDVFNTISDAIKMPDDVKALGKAVVEALQEGLKTVVSQMGHWGVEAAKMFGSAFISGAGAMLHGLFTGIARSVPGLAGGAVTGNILSMALPAYAALRVGNQFGTAPSNAITEAGAGAVHEGPWKQIKGGEKTLLPATNSMGMQAGGMMPPIITSSASPYTPMGGTEYSPTRQRYTLEGAPYSKVYATGPRYLGSPQLGMIGPTAWGGTGISSRDAVSKSIGIGLVGGSMLSSILGTDAVNTSIGASLMSFGAMGATNILAKRKTLGNRIGEEGAVGLDTTKNLMFSALPIGSMIGALRVASTYSDLRGTGASAGAWAGGMGNAVIQGMIATGMMNAGSAKNQVSEWNRLGGTNRTAALHQNALEAITSGGFETGDKAATKAFYESIGTKGHFERIAKEKNWEGAEQEAKFGEYQSLISKKSDIDKGRLLTSRMGEVSTGFGGKIASSSAQFADIAMTGGMFTSLGNSVSGLGTKLTTWGTNLSNSSSILGQFTGKLATFTGAGLNVGNLGSKIGKVVQGLPLIATIAEAGMLVGGSVKDYYAGRQRTAVEGDISKINSINFGQGDAFPNPRSTKDAFDAAIKSTDMFTGYMNEVGNQDMLKSFSDAQKGLMGKAKTGDLPNAADKLLGGTPQLFDKLYSKYNDEQTAFGKVADATINRFNAQISGEPGAGISAAYTATSTPAIKDIKDALKSNLKPGDTRGPDDTLVSGRLDKVEAARVAFEKVRTTGTVEEKASTFSTLQSAVKELRGGTYRTGVSNVLDSGSFADALKAIEDTKMEDVTRSISGKQEITSQNFQYTQGLAALQKQYLSKDNVEAAATGEYQRAMFGRETFGEAQLNVTRNLGELMGGEGKISDKMTEAMDIQAAAPENKRKISDASELLGKTDTTFAKSMEKQFQYIMDTTNTLASRIDFGKQLGDALEAKVKALRDKEADLKVQLKGEDATDKSGKLTARGASITEELAKAVKEREILNQVSGLASTTTGQNAAQQNFIDTGPQRAKEAIMTANQIAAGIMTSIAPALSYATGFGKQATTTMLGSSISQSKVVQSAINDIVSNPASGHAEIIHAAELQQKLNESQMSVRVAPYVAAQKENALSDQEYSARFGARDEYFSQRAQFASAMSQYNPSLGQRTALAHGQDTAARYEKLRDEAAAGAPADLRGMARAAHEASLAFAQAKRVDQAYKYEAISSTIGKEMEGRTENKQENYAKLFSEAMATAAPEQQGLLVAGKTLKDAGDRLIEAADNIRGTGKGSVATKEGEGAGATPSANVPSGGWLYSPTKPTQKPAQKVAQDIIKGESLAVAMEAEKVSATQGRNQISADLDKRRIESNVPAGLRMADNDALTAGGLLGSTGIVRAAKGRSIDNNWLEQNLEKPKKAAASWETAEIDASKPTKFGRGVFNTSASSALETPKAGWMDWAKQAASDLLPDMLKNNKGAIHPDLLTLGQGKRLSGAFSDTDYFRQMAEDATEISDAQLGITEANDFSKYDKVTKKVPKAQSFLQRMFGSQKGAINTDLLTLGQGEKIANFGDVLSKSNSMAQNVFGVPPITEPIQTGVNPFSPVEYAERKAAAAIHPQLNLPLKGAQSQMDLGLSIPDAARKAEVFKETNGAELFSTQGELSLQDEILHGPSQTEMSLEYPKTPEMGADAAAFKTQTEMPLTDVQMDMNLPEGEPALKSAEPVSLENIGAKTAEEKIAGVTRRAALREAEIAAQKARSPLGLLKRGIVAGDRYLGKTAGKIALPALLAYEGSKLLNSDDKTKTLIEDIVPSLGNAALLGMPSMMTGELSKGELEGEGAYPITPEQFKKKKIEDFKAQLPDNFPITDNKGNELIYPDMSPVGEGIIPKFFRTHSPKTAAQKEQQEEEKNKRVEAAMPTIDAQVAKAFPAPKTPEEKEKERMANIQQIADTRLYDKSDKGYGMTAEDLIRKKSEEAHKGIHSDDLYKERAVKQHSQFPIVNMMRGLGDKLSGSWLDGLFPTSLEDKTITTPEELKHQTESTPSTEAAVSAMDSFYTDTYIPSAVSPKKVEEHPLISAQHAMDLETLPWQQTTTNDYGQTMRISQSNAPGTEDADYKRNEYAGRQAADAARATKANRDKYDNSSLFRKLDAVGTGSSSMGGPIFDFGNTQSDTPTKWGSADVKDNGLRWARPDVTAGTLPGVASLFTSNAGRGAGTDAITSGVSSLQAYGGITPSASASYIPGASVMGGDLKGYASPPPLPEGMNKGTYFSNTGFSIGATGEPMADIKSKVDATAPVSLAGLNSYSGEQQRESAPTVATDGTDKIVSGLQQVVAAIEQQTKKEMTNVPV